MIPSAKRLRDFENLDIGLGHWFLLLIAGGHGLPKRVKLQKSEDLKREKCFWYSTIAETCERSPSTFLK